MIESCRTVVHLMTIGTADIRRDGKVETYFGASAGVSPAGLDSLRRELLEP